MISRKIALIAFCFTVLGCSEEQSAPAKTKTMRVLLRRASARVLHDMRKREDGSLHMLIKGSR